RALARLAQELTTKRTERPKARKPSGRHCVVLATARMRSWPEINRPGKVDTVNKRYIDILQVTHLRGPSMWTYPPVLEALIDIGTLEDHPSNTLPGFYERLSSWLPGLIEHR